MVCAHGFVNLSRGKALAFVIWSHPLFNSTVPFSKQCKNFRWHFPTSDLINKRTFGIKTLSHNNNFTIEVSISRVGGSVHVIDCFCFLSPDTWGRIKKSSKHRHSKTISHGSDLSCLSCQESSNFIFCRSGFSVLSTLPVFVTKYQLGLSFSRFFHWTK